MASGEGAPRQQGILAVWNDDRGFGFVTPTAGGPRVFVHVSAFPRGRRPDTDCLVTYAVGRDERNRLRASDVRYVVPVRSRRTGTRGLRPALFTAALFFTCLVALVVVGRLPGLLLVAYGVFSVGAFAMYRADKTAAQQGAWRTPETNLHAIALLGGWPGALVARRVFRHKDDQAAVPDRLLGHGHRQLPGTRVVRPRRSSDAGLRTYSAPPRRRGDEG